ncbi:MAG TPA: gluconate 2-dehydrogenase subunit 3 family protein [Terriglobia bacterium]|nr:gluconate 2-dehydrogenase subunit 3 family protein [Terriglobia bacterium]
MEKNSSLPVLTENKSSARALNRREWIARMLGGVTAGFAFPGLAAAHPVRELLADSSTLEKADASVAAADWTPEFLDSFQAASLTALAERIIPGSSRAEVARFIDTLLSVDKLENRERFLNSLTAFESEAMKKFGHSYKDLTETQQNEILTMASTADSGHPQSPGGRRRRRASLGPPIGASGQEHDTIRDQFENLKGWVQGAYYSSEVGMRELGWTGEVMFESYPGCDHPGGHA